ncbi:flagellar biosynthesis anti-sigma factor FlgM [Caballeronia sp. SEWSISQ10-4 2]|uniref:flagellar biosynthesis anti-sigma factor FlgM n=1 Tax=Caballeronia sp. SEWSISQ10-4 2 TaxID=2937438 RepID=UPI002650CA4C|nr:flagellar biosynthesis anti-sigma factor FlgM [Caballeronia sp. SEWSISQ10-4 2]MDN7182048.1 flagellar biosynthesis anti-sigma factor FlgM [Caballeronia sp. SEWSISQ10-4 2]
MKIDSSNTTQIAALQEAAQQRTAQADAQGTSTTGSSTASTGSPHSTVSLSALSTDLRTSGTSDIDTAKVASIKAALNDGSYKVDSGAVANGMLSSAHELMQTRTPPAGG